MWRASSCEPISAPGVNNIKVYVTEKHKAGAVDFVRQASREFEFMTSTFGQPESGRINIVELPDDSVSACVGAGGCGDWREADRMTTISQRLLANTLAHQWWG